MLSRGFSCVGICYLILSVSVKMSLGPHLSVVYCCCCCSQFNWLYLHSGQTLSQTLLKLSQRSEILTMSYSTNSRTLSIINHINRIKFNFELVPPALPQCTALRCLFEAGYETILSNGTFRQGSLFLSKCIYTLHLDSK